MSVVERRAKELITDCYNLWTKWTEIHTKSLLVVERIGNKRILLMDPESSSTVDTTFDVDECKSDLTNCCEILRDILHEFDRLVSKVYKVRTNFETLRLLASSTNASMIFASWSVDRVFDAIVVVHEQLKDEIKCKSVVFDTLPFAVDRQTIEVCTASWVHQPYLDENRINFLLNAITTEAGLV